MIANKLSIRTAPAPQPCVICNVKMDAWEDTAHMTKHHVAQAVKIGEILWLNPHEAVFRGRHYKPAPR